MLGHRSLCAMPGTAAGKVGPAPPLCGDSPGRGGKTAPQSPACTPRIFVCLAGSFSMMQAMRESPAASIPAIPLKCADYMPRGLDGEHAARTGLSQVALGLVGSEILKIAAAVRALQAKGHKI